MKSKILIVSLIANGLLVGALCYSYYTYKKKPDIIFKEGPIKYITIKKDVKTLPREELETDYSCYLTSKPMLNVTSKAGDESLLIIRAGLCEREWSKEVKLKIKNKPARNLFTGGAFLFVEFPVFDMYYGAKIGYFRYCRALYIGCEIFLSRSIKNNYGVGVSPTVVFSF